MPRPPGQTKELAVGVRWLRMPMGGSLDHINVGALEDRDGWTVVDAGLQTRETAGHRRAALAGPLGRRPVNRVMTTHMHPDHIGLAGWLVRKHACRLWMTRLDHISCRMLVADTGREAPEDGIRFYQAAGWDQDAIERYRIKFGGFGKAIHALPIAIGDCPTTSGSRSAARPGAWWSATAIRRSMPASGVKAMAF